MSRIHFGVLIDKSVQFYPQRIDIWRDLVTLRADDGERRTVTLDQLKQEVGPPGAPRPDTERERS